MKAFTKIQSTKQIKMTTPIFNTAILRRPEMVSKQIKELLSLADGKYQDVAELAQMAIKSAATNDYLEKIAIEAIGGTHSSAKLGPDGYISGRGIEAKPHKGTPGEKMGGVINDDTPMKLIKDLQEIDWIIFVNANKSGDQVNFAVLAPFDTWADSRYTQIVKHLGLCQPLWKWSETELPKDPEERKKCLGDLLAQHKPKHYVRSSPLSLELLCKVPKEKRSIWVHPDLSTESLHKCIRTLL
jgi:hypothetical protein